MDEGTGKFKFRFNKPSDYKILFANGAYGGMTTRGDFLLHFFHEYLPIPLAEVVVADEKGDIKDTQPVRDKAEMEFGKPDYVRDLVVGISLSPEQAVAIANFILDRVKMAESAKREASS
ncbi:MAG: hypothetical protein ACHQ03_01615 [Candidatus Bathyarchaeia archaeon]